VTAAALAELEPILVERFVALACADSAAGCTPALDSMP
jgi:hypothetical protein